MDPIEFIVPIDPSIEGPRKLYDAPETTGGPSMEALTERFQTLMSQDSPSATMADTAPNGLTLMLDRQEELMRSNEAYSNDLRENSPYMSMAEMHASAMHLSHSVSLSNFKLTTASTLSSSTNKSLQSLLKNS